MAVTAAAPKFEAWTVPGRSVRIEYSALVLDEIRRAAVDGYHRVPHGGVETGGILFGTHGKNTVQISAWRPLVCNYTKGPSFLLSEAEEAALPAQLQEWSSMPELAGLEPVGWYRAHNRSEILLADADLNFFNRFFPEPWQIALIVRPASFAPTRAGFFFRESSGDIRKQSSYHEFVVTPLPAAALPDAHPVVEKEAPAPPRPAPADITPFGVPADSLDRLLTKAPQALVPAKPPRRRKRLALVATSVVAAVALGFWLFTPARGLSLSVRDDGGQLRIAWDGAASAVAHATGGSLEILDRGNRTEVKLTPADLRSGSILYARESGDVELRLMIYLPGGPPVSAVTRFVIPGRPPATSAVRAAAPAVHTSPPPAPVVPQSVGPKALASTAAIQPPRPQLPPPAETKRRIVAFKAPVKPTVTPSTPIPALAPPPIEDQPVNPQTSSLPSVLGSSASAPAAPRPVRTAPESGKIVWTGKLPKDGRLVIQGGHASSGTLNAALPSRPLLVSAYPGELNANGMMLYSQESKFAQPRTEAPAAENGWNRTTYTLDAKRASAIRVVQLPGPGNGYQLVLEGNSPKLTIVVLEWRTP